VLLSLRAPETRGSAGLPQCSCAKHPPNNREVGTKGSVLRLDRLPRGRHLLVNDGLAVNAILDGAEDPAVGADETRQFAGVDEFLGLHSCGSFRANVGSIS